MFKKILLAVFFFFIITLAGAYVYLSQTYPNSSPLLTLQYYIESFKHPHTKLTKHVMGFLPYWRLSDIPNLKPESLSEINYFSITARASGHFATTADNEMDPGWKGWLTQDVKDLITKSRILGTDFTVTIAALENERIEGILDSKDAQTTLISEITNLVKTNGLSGVTIDFEYFGEPDEDYKQKFTLFSQNLATKLKKESPNAKLSLALMPLSARNSDIYDFKKLAPIYDRFIGMSYDFYGEHADIAGPVSPMRGFKEHKYFFDVETMYEDFAKVLPKDKIIMGVPYYGWDRAVLDGKTITSETYSQASENNYAAVISYARAREDKTINPKQCSWDTYALETWCWYTDENGIDHQVWIADNKSISTRFDYANKQNFSGIGIWVLGYDKTYPDLWNMITQKFTK